MSSSDQAEGQSLLERDLLMRARVEQIERDLRGWAEKPIEFAFDPSGTLLPSLIELRQSYAKRSVDLADSIRFLVEQNRIAPATVIARALIETIAMGCLYLHDMSRLVESGDHQRLEERLVRYYAGMKGKEVEPIHVMDAMRHFEKIDGEYTEYLDQKHGAFTKFFDGLRKAGVSVAADSPRELISALDNYAELSEVSHPNGVGTQLLYPAQGFGDTTFEHVQLRFRQSAHVAIWQCHFLLTALEKSTDLPERYKAAFM